MLGPWQNNQQSQCYGYLLQNYCSLSCTTVHHNEQLIHLLLVHAQWMIRSLWKELLFIHTLTLLFIQTLTGSTIMILWNWKVYAWVERDLKLLPKSCCLCIIIQQNLGWKTTLRREHPSFKGYFFSNFSHPSSDPESHQHMQLGRLYWEVNCLTHVLKSVQWLLEGIKSTIGTQKWRVNSATPVAASFF